MKKTLFAFGIPRSGGASGYCSATPRAALDAALSTATPEQIGGTRGTRHFGRVVRVEETVVTIESRPLKWRGAPRYWWKRFANGQPRHLRRKGLSRRVHRALRKAGQL